MNLKPAGLSIERTVSSMFKKVVSVVAAMMLLLLMMCPGISEGPAAEEANPDYFYVKNALGMAITEVYIHPGNVKALGRCRNADWIRVGETGKITLTESEIDTPVAYTIHFCMYWNNGYFFFDAEGCRLKDVLGKTLVFTQYADHVELAVEE